MDSCNILIVGGAGFVGSNLCSYILDNFQIQKVVIIDNFLSSERKNVPTDHRVKLIDGSITHDAILSDLTDEFDYIFHLATYHGNQSSIHDPLADHENNTLTSLKLMNHIQDFKRLKKLVYSSAGCSVAKKTFHEVEATTEDSPISLHQDSPYSISKVIGEFYSVYFYKHTGLPTVRARFQNVYGPGEILGAGIWRGTPATIWRNVTPTFIYKALKGQPLPVENEGIATRDFIYVIDICRGLVACALDGIPGDVYNIASGHPTSILELAETINKLTGNIDNIEFQPKRKWDNSGKRFGSTEKASKDLNFHAKIELPEGLSYTIDWTKKNFDFIEQCISKHYSYIN